MFPNWDIYAFEKKWRLNQNFDIELLPEAVIFLETLEEKQGKKYIIMQEKPSTTMTLNYLKSSTNISGSLELCIMARRTEFFHFGIQETE